MQTATDADEEEHVGARERQVVSHTRRRGDGLLGLHPFVMDRLDCRPDRRTA